MNYGAELITDPIKLFPADLLQMSMVASTGELKHAIEESLGCLWKQFVANKQRLQEARKLVRSQRRANKRVKDGGSKQPQPRRGKKKVAAEEDFSDILVGPLEEAELLRDNLLFQLLDLQREILAIVRSADGFVEVWTAEVQELMAWSVRGGALEDGGEGGEEAEEGSEEENVPEGPPAEEKQPSKRLKKGVRIVRLVGRGEERDYGR